MKGFISVLLLLLLTSPALADKLYKWVDAEGRTHYSDTPPADPNTATTDVSSELKAVNRSQANKETKKLGDVFPKETVEEQRYRQKQQQQAQKQQNAHQKRCRQARRDLKRLQGRVVFVDADGKRYTITEKERIQRAEQMQQLVNRYCK